VSGAIARRDAAALLADPIGEAALDTIRARGYAEASVEEFVSRAGMTRAEFDRRFADKEEVTRLLIEAHLDRFLERVGGAYERVADWPANLRAAAYETARYLEENPDMTWFMLVGVLEADDMARARRDQIFGWAAGLIDAGRETLADPDSVPRSAPLMAVGAIVETLRRHHAEGSRVDVAENLPWLMYAAVRPYLGEEAARAELKIEVPVDLRPPRAAGADRPA
jgi:AcrR family transcriptional regulator